MQLLLLTPSQAAADAEDLQDLEYQHRHTSSKQKLPKPHVKFPPPKLHPPLGAHTTREGEGEGEGEGGSYKGEMKESSSAPAASMAAGEERWRHLDSSVNAVSFGFVATAVLILMFLVMAIFERFIRSPSSRNSPRPYPHHQNPLPGKLHDHPSPNMSTYASGVSVLMPGQAVPTYIAHPAPPPCDPERIPWPSHETLHIGGSTSRQQEQVRREMQADDQRR